MKTKHTPGPWRLDYSPDEGWSVAGADPYMPMATLTNEADARLIAAAPDMYAALEALEYDLKAWPIAAAALAKARGKQERS